MSCLFPRHSCRGTWLGTETVWHVDCLTLTLIFLFWYLYLLQIRKTQQGNLPGSVGRSSWVKDSGIFGAKVGFKRSQRPVDGYGGGFRPKPLWRWKSKVQCTQCCRTIEIPLLSWMSQTLGKTVSLSDQGGHVGFLPSRNRSWKGFKEKYSLAV